MQGRAGLLLAALALLPAPAPVRAEEAPPAAGPILVDDFEAETPRDGWTAEDATIRIVASGSGGALEITGTGVIVDSVTRASGPLPVKDLRGIGALAFRAGSRDGPKRISVFLRKGTTRRVLEETYVELSGEMQEFVLPLRLMAGGGAGFLPDPADLDRVQFQWNGPDAGAIVVDDIRLLPGDRGVDSWRPSDEDLRDLAYGKGKGRIHPGKRFSFICEDADAKAPSAIRLLNEMEKGLTFLKAHFNLEPAPGFRLPVIEAQTLNGEHGLGVRMRLWFMARGLDHGNPLDMGFEMFHLVESTERAREPGPPRLVGVEKHVEYSLGVTDSCWLVDAIMRSLARRADPDGYAEFEKYSGKFTPADFVATLQGKPDGVPPWSELLEARNDMRALSAIATVGEFLASKHRANLPKAWDAVRACPAISMDEVLPAVAGALGRTPAKLEEEWARWGAASWK